jgi:hypothetical protein
VLLSAALLLPIPAFAAAGLSFTWSNLPSSITAVSSGGNNTDNQLDFNLPAGQLVQETLNLQGTVSGTLNRHKTIDVILNDFPKFTGAMSVTVTIVTPQGTTQNQFAANGDAVNINGTERARFSSASISGTVYVGISINATFQSSNVSPYLALLPAQ